jgi:hypothetical protein
VGIGTSSPSAKAHIYDASTDAALYVDSGNANGSHMRFLASGSVKHFVGSGGGFGVGDADDFAIRSFDNTIFTTGNSSTERMRITSDGSVLAKNGAADASQFIFNDGWSAEARNIRVWAEEEVSGGIGRWFSFLGTNVSKDGDGTYTKPSDDAGSNWGNIAGMLFTGANSAGQNAIDFVVDLPSAHGGGLNASMSGSDLYNKSAMSITADGNVGIGTTSPQTVLHVYNSSQSRIGMENSARRFDIMADGDGLTIRDQSAAVNRFTINTSGNLVLGNSGVSFTSDRLQVKSPSNEPVASFYRPRNTGGGGLVRFMSDVGGTQTIVAQVTSEGNFFTNGGINFGSIGGSVTSKTLDDYEEGTWNPKITGNSAAFGQTYTSQLGRYTKIGNYVYLTYDVHLSDAGSPQGTYMVLGNLPFTPASGNHGGSLNVAYHSGWQSLSTEHITGYIGGSNAYLMNGGSDYIRIGDGNHTSSSRLIGSAWFVTS